VADFIIRSVEAALKSEFDLSLADKDVHVLTLSPGQVPSSSAPPERLIELPTSPASTRTSCTQTRSSPCLLHRRYHIEATTTTHGEAYRPFEGIVLADTFQMAEDGDSMDQLIFPENNDRIVRQKKAEIRVVIGNPPTRSGKAVRTTTTRTSFIQLSIAASARPT